MRKVLIMALFLMIPAGVAFAQPGSFGLFADPTGIDCNVQDVAGLKPVYVVHVGTSAASAGEFSAVKPACWTGASFLSDTAVFPVTLGNSQTGVSIGYGSCRTAPIHVLTIQFFAGGATQACCVMTVTEHPATGADSPQMTDCAVPNPGLFNATGGSCILFTGAAPDPTCVCNPAVEESTWGQVKALYYPEE